jgi:hypothetical protein
MDDHRELTADAAVLEFIDREARRQGRREVIEAIEAMIPPKESAPGPCHADMRALIAILRHKFLGEPRPEYDAGIAPSTPDEREADGR